MQSEQAAGSADGRFWRSCGLCTCSLHRGLSSDIPVLSSALGIQTLTLFDQHVSRAAPNSRLMQDSAQHLHLLNRSVQLTSGQVRVYFDSF